MQSLEHTPQRCPLPQQTTYLLIHVPWPTYNMIVHVHPANMIANSSSKQMYNMDVHIHTRDGDTWSVPEVETISQRLRDHLILLMK
jgi:hypothetical protein